MSPAAVAMTTTLHLAVAAALYWISPLHHIDTTPDPVEITMEREVSPPKPETPQPTPTPEPTPPPQAAAPPAPSPPAPPPGPGPDSPPTQPRSQGDAWRRAACAAQARNTGHRGHATRTTQAR